jgi:hypothetical protein
MSTNNTNDSEEKIQADYNCWVVGYYPKLRDYSFHIPNGGSRSGREGNKLKAMGVRRGLPDYWHVVPLNGFTGLLVEFKEPGANMNTEHVKNQLRVQEQLRLVGYKVAVCDNLNDAKAVFLDYFKGTSWLVV